MLLLPALIGHAQGDTKSPDDEDVPAYNDLVARSFFIEVEPLVEKHTGWECEWPVSFRLVTRAQYVEQSANEVRDRVSSTVTKSRQGEMQTALRQVLKSRSVGLLGRYSSISKSILLLPGNLKPVLRSMQVEERYSRDLIEVILAHELTHYVQDAHFDIGEHAAAITNQDEFIAWTMLVEGHASWVADRVASDLKLDEAAARLGEGMAESAIVPNSASSRSIRDASQRGYVQGKKFVEEVFKKGGLPAVQALFTKPPKDPALIEDPELFFKMQDKK
jgi:hypothetical protein